jgi:hypothetical protein
MPVQDRPTEHLIKSGNYFKDAVDNIVEIIEREQKDDTDSKLKYIKRVHKVFDHDVFRIPSLPAIAVSWVGWREQVRTIGQRSPVRFTIEVFITIYYYHGELSRNIRKEEIRDALWELARILRRNEDLNGLSSLGATITDGQMMNRMRANEGYAGGQINLVVPISVDDRRGIS